MKLKRYRKYQLGGYNPNQDTEGFTNTAVGVVGAVNPVIGAALKLGQGIGRSTMDENGIYKSKAGEFIDNSINPSKGITNLKDTFGTLFSGKSGGYKASTVANQLSLGLFGKSPAQRRAKEELQRKLDAQRVALEDQSIANTYGYDFTGGENASIYRSGGSLLPLNSDTVAVKGRSHEQGGVKIPEVGAEVEGNETIANNYVFSDYLGFADRHKPIARQIGNIEKKPLNRERRVSLEILRKKEAALKDQQENVRAAIGADTQTQMQLGGPMNDLTNGSALTEPEGVPKNPASIMSYIRTRKAADGDNSDTYDLSSLSASDRALTNSRLRQTNYTRGNFDAYQNAVNAGGDPKLTDYNLSDTELREFGNNPWLKSVTRVEGLPNDANPNLVLSDYLTNRTYTDPYASGVPDVNIPTQALVSNQVPTSLAAMYKPKKKASSIPGGTLKLSHRSDVVRTGYNRGKGRLGFTTSR
jgi:hypothetical protein